MSIRLRFSLLYGGILAITLVVFGAVLYLTQAQYSLNWLKNDLVISSNTLAESVLRIYLESRPTGQENGPTPPSNFTQLSSNQELQNVSESEIVRVLDPNGTVIASPFGTLNADLPLGDQGMQAINQERDWWETATINQERLLIYSRPVLAGGRIISILQVARRLTERDQSLLVLGRTLVIAALVGGLAAFGTGWLLAGFFLRPIQSITRTARAIGNERDFTRRVVSQGPQDEVGQLAGTFNLMLAQLEDAYQKTARALDMQRSFVADVSHELRTPLTTLRGNLGLLSRKPPIPMDEQADVVNDMVDESDRLIRLVNELLVLARAESGRNLAKTSLSIGPLLEEACRQARQLDPQRLISLHMTGDAAIQGDRDALKQVLIILLDNAIKHSQGEVSVHAEKDESRVTICVIDTGTGMPAEIQAHVFERFYRGEDRRLTSGFGLGLPIAKALVEGQGGSIQLASESGKGTRITLVFPVQ
jgi:two-component system, OmpR family, sensor kinase